MKLHLDRNNSSINQANKIICLENDFFIRESEKSKYCLKNIYHWIFQFGWNGSSIFKSYLLFYLYK